MDDSELEEDIEDTTEIAAIRAAQNEWLKTHGGFFDQDENGVDLSLIRENLKLTPSERLYKAQAMATLFMSFREVGKNAGL